MNEALQAAYLIAEMLTKGKTIEELTRLQVTLQTVSSLVTADLVAKRSGMTTSDRRPRE